MIAFLTALWRACRAVPRYQDSTGSGITVQDVLDVSICLLVSGIVFARVAFVLLDPVLRRGSISEAIAIWNGGISFDGALFGALLAIVVYSIVKKIRFLDLADLIAPSAMLGYAIGRVGCFFNGCCYGGPTNLPWGVRFHDVNQYGVPILTVPSHPAQLYSTLMSLAIFAFMVYRERKGRAFAGEQFSIYFIGSAIERFMMEFWRAGVTSDMVRGTPFTTAQFFCMLLLVFGGCAYAILKKQGRVLAPVSGRGQTVVPLP
jgi:phosphatidylglycerol:prolipoprotein diacylglycerol transferase